MANKHIPYCFLAIKKGLLLWLISPCLAWAQVDVNTARESQLDGIRGLGPSSTRRILVEREQGPFKNWADFMRRVPGFKTAKAQQLSDAGLRVQGLAFEEATPP